MTESRESLPTRRQLPGLAEAKSAALVEWVTFLESTPPNTPKVFANLAEYTGTSTSGKHWKVVRPRLQLHCTIDGGERGFDIVDTSTDVGYQFFTYRCRDCGRTMKTFAVLIAYKDRENGVLEIMKLGEYTPFAAPVSARIGKLLGEGDLELYRKGSRAEAQGLGIGAATYFRRIVENEWHLLVRELRQAAVGRERRVGVR